MIKNLFIIGLCLVFMISKVSAMIFAAAGETITITASCTDKDCTGTDDITYSWSDETIDAQTRTLVEAFPNGYSGTDKSSVQWKAPDTSGEINVKVTCDDTPGNDNDNPAYDVITVRVISVDIDIWNGKTNGTGNSVSDSSSPEDETEVGACLLVNWDDNNDDDDPDLDDSSVTGENDLSKIYLDCSIAGIGTLELIKTGTNIKIWQNATKGTEQTTLSWNLASTTPPAFLWVEGTGASTSERDVELELKYTIGETTVSDKVKATVVEIRLGNAVYQENQLLGDVGHAELVTGYTGQCNSSDLNDASKFQITEMPGPYESVATDTLVPYFTNNSTN